MSRSYLNFVAATYKVSKKYRSFGVSLNIDK